MADELVKKEGGIRKKLEGTLQAGSLGQLVKERQVERETFLLLDYSSSMADSVSPYGLTRKIDALRQVAHDLRDDVSCPQVGFGGYAQSGGIRFLAESIPEPSGGTPLAEGIFFCKQQGAKHLIVVSDGAPNDREAALQAARDFDGPIDVFYVGPEGDAGAEFMKRLAEATKGRVQVTTLKETKFLTSAIRGLLAGATS